MGSDATAIDTDCPLSPRVGRAAHGLTAGLQGVFALVPAACRSVVCTGESWVYPRRRSGWRFVGHVWGRGGQRTRFAGPDRQRHHSALPAGFRVAGFRAGGGSLLGPGRSRRQGWTVAAAAGAAGQNGHTCHEQQRTGQSGGSFDPATPIVKPVSVLHGIPRSRGPHPHRIIMHRGCDPGGYASALEEVPTRTYADLHAKYFGPDRFGYPHRTQTHRSRRARQRRRSRAAGGAALRPVVDGRPTICRPARG